MSADKIDQITESIASKNSVEIHEEDKSTSVTNSSSSEVSTKNNVEEIAQEMSADKIDQITESIASENNVEIHEEDKLTSITNSSSSEVVIESKLEEITQEMSQDMINQITQSVASANIIEMLSLQNQITNQLESASTVSPDNAIEIFGETFSGSYSTIDSPKITNSKNNEKIHVWRSEKNRTTNDYNFYKLRQDNKFELVYEKVDDGPTLSSGTSVSSGLKKANINIQALNEDSTPAYGFNLSNLEETISEKPEIKKAPFELTTYFNNEAYTYTGTFIQQDNSKLLKAEAKNKETNQVSVIILWNPDTSETCVKELTGEPITQTCKSFN